MDLNRLEMIVVKKQCPKCDLGMVRETAARIYKCDRSQCGEIFDFSLLSDAMIDMLLDRKKTEVGKRDNGTS